MKLIIQNPGFNDADTLAGARADLPRTLPGFEVVEWRVVDDGSTDDAHSLRKQRIGATLSRELDAVSPRALRPLPNVASSTPGSDSSKQTAPARSRRTGSLRAKRGHRLCVGRPTSYHSHTWSRYRTSRLSSRLEGSSSNSIVTGLAGSAVGVNVWRSLRQASSASS